MVTKYNVGDFVEFCIRDQNDVMMDVDGVIEIVNEGTFLNPTVVSYDIYAPTEKLFYKHIQEGQITRKIRIASDNERLSAEVQGKNDES